MFGRGQCSNYDRRGAFNKLYQWVIETNEHCLENDINPASVAKYCKSAVGAATTILFNAHDICELDAEGRYQEVVSDTVACLPGFRYIIKFVTESAICTKTSVWIFCIFSMGYQLLTLT